MLPLHYMPEGMPGLEPGLVAPKAKYPIHYTAPATELPELSRRALILSSKRGR